MPQKRDKTTGLPLPNPVTPPTTVCVTMTIPNAPQYIQALRGVVADLGKWWTWQHTAGQSTDNANEAAELWRKAATTIVYVEDCEIDMSCEDVADCIDDNTVVQNAITNQITNNVNNITSIQNIVSELATPGVTATPGVPMTTAQASAPLNPLVGCNHDEFWAQCQQFTEYATTAGTDLLEKIEAYTNAVEAAGFIEMVPVIGTIMDETQLDKVIQFLDWTVETVTELYAAQLDENVKQAIACAYFCEGKDDCILSIDRIFQIHNERLGSVFTPSAIDTIEELINAVITISTNPGNVVDAWLITIAGLAKVAGYLGARGIDQTLALVLKLAVNDANNDWEILCEDCAPPPVAAWEITHPVGRLGGVIDAQTNTSITAHASPNSDGIWRLVFRRVDLKCFDIATITTTPNPLYPSWANCANVYTNALATASSNIKVISYASTGSFTLTMTGAVIP